MWKGSWFEELSRWRMFPWSSPGEALHLLWLQLCRSPRRTFSGDVHFRVSAVASGASCWDNVEGRNPVRLPAHVPVAWAAPSTCPRQLGSPGAALRALGIPQHPGDGVCWQPASDGTLGTCHAVPRTCLVGAHRLQLFNRLQTSRCSNMRAGRVVWLLVFETPL